ncbi:hypothetical protein [Novosphingobium sp.]|uniref:hypothetical protein n=1 Tax=Novosphingobium sp. TaxID=1874826 RepID=UPI001EB3511B|nr:hypothetical protein [Novosphingobium sp.]MBK9009382.1 hypothetical protein [Novosphingobium sp.]
MAFDSNGKVTGCYAGAKRLVFGATAVLIGIMIGFCNNVPLVFSGYQSQLSRKKAVVDKVSSSLIKSDTDFMHATSSELKIFPIYFSDRNCVVVRPFKPIAFSTNAFGSNEIMYCFDKNWSGPPQRVVDVTLHLKSDVPESCSMTLLSGQGHLLDRDVEVQDRPAHRTRSSLAL